jgi:hypothetical protein
MTAALRRAAFCALLLITLEASPVLAHCDTLAGPVVTSARAALEQRNLQPLLKWVKPGAEAELKSAFDITLRVRTEGGAARELADRYFFETAVRLHRAGEGAPYTGLKVEVDDPAGLIAASDKALDAAAIEPLTKLVVEKVAAGLRERHARVVAARAHADHTVDAGRQFVEAYVDYVHYVEALQQLVVTAGAGQSVHRHDK